jgi:hypothetical protein
MVFQAADTRCGRFTALRVAQKSWGVFLGLAARAFCAIGARFG